MRTPLPLDIDTKVRKLAVLTSGGDSAGMNAAVRAVVRMGITRGCQMYVIREGWQGLVNGNATSQAPTPSAPARANSAFSEIVGEGELLKEGESDHIMKGRYIVPVGWDDVRGYLREGGTLIGTARCAAFRTIEGRRRAASNLIKHGIDALVVCGGDGSLTGADVLRSEWPDHLAALRESGKITEQQAQTYKHLNIVGLVGSIDNDMAMTDLTIGAPTALHRICEAVDSISCTASSHSRAFVIEVMGRHCGWLAVMAAAATGADYCFIPERPPKGHDWKAEMVKVLQAHRDHGKRKSIVIVAEGAISRDLEPITANAIKEVLEQRGLDTRVTTLGHTQRGGAPCAYDRIMATLQGAEAVETILDATPDSPSYVIGLKENKIVRINLMESVKATQEVAKAIAAKDFDKAMGLRDSEFEDSVMAFIATARLDDDLKLPLDQRLRIAILHVGAPAGGMNAATRTAVRYCLTRGHAPLAVYNSWAGLMDDNITELQWLRVDQWTTRGGSELGTNRTLPDPEAVAAKIKQHRIDGIMVIGGFEALNSLFILEQARHTHAGLNIPMVHLPATISNNVPVTDWSLGSDTSVNVLMEACDVIKQSASASRNRVFVVECQGGESGFLAILGALASGAVVVYTPEVGMNLAQLTRDVKFLRRLYAVEKKGKSEGRLLIKSEKASKVYTTDVLTNILREEGAPIFDSRYVSLGHTLQGNTPTPRDRVRGVRLAVKCIDFLEQHALNLKGLRPSVPGVAGMQDVLATRSKFAVMAIQGGDVKLVNLKDMREASDMKNRRGQTAWWSNLKSLVELLGGRRDLSEVRVASQRFLLVSDLIPA
ncbi:6-phosphofructokinase [Atractiella rhizophila]|nr:6-phosphofructokinase [Atractiella rhizophila]